MNDSEAIAAAAVDKALALLVGFDLTGDGEGSGAGQSVYIQSHRFEYVRTVRDVLKHRPPGNGPVRVLEIGAFFGVVCFALADLGYEVTAADIPEYIEMPSQVRRYADHNIATKGVRLEEFLMPFEDESFDVIIMCEVLEHLNFNPLPLIKEINRIGKPGSIFYLSLPNLSRMKNRKNIMKGEGIGVTVSSMFKQLDPSDPELANGHWREYTMPEIREILERLGYRLAEHYYFSLGETQSGRGVRGMVGNWLYKTFPTLKENQTAIAIRDKRTDLVFDIPSTVHRELRQL
jgi:SAM-dependent methyltransferase